MSTFQHTKLSTYLDFYPSCFVYLECMKSMMMNNNVHFFLLKLKMAEIKFKSKYERYLVSLIIIDTYHYYCCC